MNLIKSSGIYTVSSLINAAIPFLLLPVLTKYLEPEEYGLLSLYTVAVAFIIPVISLGTIGLISVEYFKLKKSEFKEYLNSIFYVPVFMFFIIAIVVFLFKENLSSLLGFEEKWILLIPVFALVQIIPTIVLALLQIKERPYLYAILQISRTIINVGLSLFFIVYLGYNWEGRLLAIFISFFLFTIVGFVVLYKLDLLKISFNLLYIKDAIKYGSPLILHTLSGFIFSMSDRFFISVMLGNKEVGLYAVGYQIGMIVNFVGSSFNSAWVPFLFKNLKENKPNTKKKIVRYTYLIFVFYLTLPFLLFYSSKLIIFRYFINIKYESALNFVFIIALGYSFLGMYKMITNYLFFEKKTKVLAISTFSSAVLNLVLNYVFIHKFGAIGAAYSTTLTMFVFFLIIFFVADKVHPMPWFYRLKKEPKPN